MAVLTGPLQVEVLSERLRRDGQEDPRVLREQVVRLDGHRGHREAEGQRDHGGEHRKALRLVGSKLTEAGTALNISD